MIVKIRDSKWTKFLAAYVSLSMLFQLIQPGAAYALTGGPTQPETNSFTPMGTSDMVDLFSGDFNYNIPLMDVGGYPLNLAYSGNTSMDTESSWVGLGWNINPGVINRGMRGLPDDFKGEQVTQEFNMRPNISFGAQANAEGIEIFGYEELLDADGNQILDNLGNVQHVLPDNNGEGVAVGMSLSFGMGVTYNNYNGLGFSQSVSPNFEMGKNGSEGNTASLGASFTASEDGLDISPSVSFSGKMDKEKKLDKIGIGIGASINSRGGLKSINMNASASGKWENGLGEPGKFGKVGTSLSFVNNTYVPEINMPRQNTSISARVKVGGALFGGDADLSVSGFYSEQRLVQTNKSLPAYGYMFSEEGQENDHAMMDFNREKDRPFTHNATNMPVTNFTYDAFSIAGQGVGGMFRPRRSDIGYVHDPYSYTFSSGQTVGFELATGNAADPGGELSMSAVEGHSGMWEDDNAAKDQFLFGSKKVNDEFEPFYFKQEGELAIDDEFDLSGNSLFKNMGGYDAVQIPIEKTHGFHVESYAEYGENNKLNSTPIDKTARDTRDKRNQAITYLNKTEAGLFGVEKYVSPHGGDHHISEMTVLRNDGARYVYGIPAYNVEQKEVSFNISGENGDCQNGLVGYTSGVDNSVNNKRGRDNYFSSKTTPAYAHSYLLTSVLSNDYIDVDNNGPSLNDYGSYTKFGYGDEDKREPSIKNYKWRVPVQENSANYSQGLKPDLADDRGSYIYGEKDLWYLNTIETKTHVAVFHKSDRNDGYEVIDENGGVDFNEGRSTQKLDSISLYSIGDWNKNYTTSDDYSALTPIKQVHFVYDYSLCKGVPNNPAFSQMGAPDEIRGKLTLIGLYFTYEGSEKGALSDYKFNYGDYDHNGIQDQYNGIVTDNPDYNLKGYDFWGCYKYNEGNCSVDNDVLTNPEFAYVEQIKALQNQSTSAWKLTSIELPSGGILQINRESDDYNYVQDQKAMQMAKITGTGSSAGGTVNSKFNLNSIDHYLFFELDPNVSASSSAEVQDQYGFDGELYFRFLIDMTNSLDSPDESHEYVEGYVPVTKEDFGYDATNGAYVKLVGENVTAQVPAKVNPIQKAAWNFGKMNLPRLIYDLPDPASAANSENPVAGQIINVVKTLATPNMVKAIAETVVGANGMLYAKGYCRNFKENKSWIRVNHPGTGKLGGGCRVKSIEMHDMWSDMAGGNASDFKYGQEYTYTLEDGTSSGVATYEPIGSKENPIIQPIAFTEEHLLASNDEHYFEAPFGESFYPSPSVGYSRVTVKNLERTGVKRHATGYVEHKFYTAKDYPVITKETSLVPKPRKTNPFGTMLKLSIRDFMTISQGYSIELNDMHGKPRAQRVYAEGKEEYISGVDYIYDVNSVTIDEGPTGDPFESFTAEHTNLDNTVIVINPDGTIDKKQVGISFDVVNDFRESETVTQEMGASVNTASFLAGVIYGVVPTVWPSYTYQKTRFRSAGTTKVISRKGILREVVAHDAGASVSTKNLAWDGQTGEVLLTQTTNEYSDKVYSFNYPAHWAYSGMGQAYHNIDAVLDIDIDGQGEISLGTTAGSIANLDNILEPGDEVALYSSDPLEATVAPSDTKYWVLQTESAGNHYYLIDEAGALYTETTQAYIKILRSGKRNQQAVSIGSITSLRNPIDIDDDPLTNQTEIDFSGSGQAAKVLAANVTEFSENWRTYCGSSSIEVTDACNHVLATLGEDLYYDNALATPSYVPSLSKGGYVFNMDAPGFVLPGSFDNDATLTVNPGFLAKFSTSDFSENGPFGTISDFSSLPIYIEGSDARRLMFETSGDHTDPSGLTTITYDRLLVYCYWEDGPLWECEPNFVATTTACGILPGDIVNPYQKALRGIWRAKRSSLYLGDREQLASSTNAKDIKVREHGVYSEFSPFWSYATDRFAENPSNWTWASEVENYIPFGQEVENRDRLGRYSAAVFGYNYKFPIAVANNATHRQIAFDGFEDYDYYDHEGCEIRHFDFKDYVDNIVSTESHTGRHSMLIAPSGQIAMGRHLKTSPTTPESDDAAYLLKEDDCVGYFGPETYNTDYDVHGVAPIGVNKTYVLSFWVKESNPDNDPIIDIGEFNAVVSVDDVNLSSGYISVGLQEIVRSAVIDGWQKVEYQFVIPGPDLNANQNILLAIHNNNSFGKNIYVDDIRIHPFNSSLKSYVYDPISLRLWAELDDRNFATFYEYDEEGKLIRIKKETERGIETIQESRTGNFKDQKPALPVK